MYFYFVSVGRSENDDNCFTYMYRVTIIEGNIYTMGGDDPTIIQGNIYTMGGGDPGEINVGIEEAIGKQFFFFVQNTSSVLEYNL